jgi:Bacterial capsule synthesis protein PGA_cap
MRVHATGNNHSLDYRPEARLDTLMHRDAAGIAGWRGRRQRARVRVPVRCGDLEVRLVAFAKHPVRLRDRRGIAFADSRAAVPRWP